MKNVDVINSISNFEPKSMKNYFPIGWKKAINDKVWDFDDNEYIDFTSTIFVQNVGHSNPRVKKYLKEQIDSDLLHTYTFASESKEKYLKRLIDVTPDFCEKAFLLSSGTEATEAAVKLMRAYTGKKKIISIKGSMHGRTMAAELMKGSNIWQQNDFINIPYPEKENSFKEEINKLQVSEIAGIILESYRGWDAKFFSKTFIEDVKKFAKAWNICICFDEVQAGMYRTGKLFAFEHYDIEPDLVCIGKGFGGGLPLSGVFGRKKILDVPNAGDMSSTHSANPLVCAAGLAVLDEISTIKKHLKPKERFFEMVINDFFDRFSIVQDVNITGLVSGIILSNETIANKVCDGCLRNGLLLVHTGKGSIKLGPPLTIETNNLIMGLKILEEVLSENCN